MELHTQARRTLTTPSKARLIHFRLLSSVFLLLLLGVFVMNLRRQSGFVGLTERIVAGAMSIWPLVLVLSIA